MDASGGEQTGGVRGAAQILLELEAGEPIHGRITGAAGAAEGFHGWVELVAALERLRINPASEAPGDAGGYRGAQS